MSMDRLLLKNSNSINNRLVLKHGLSSQGIEPAPVAGEILLVGPTPIPSTYTGGPLQVSTTSSTSIFNLTNGACDFGASMSFCGADLSRASTIWLNWDQFKLLKVTIKIECLANVQEAQTNIRPNVSIPTLYYAVDRDDADIPTLQTAVTGKSNHRQFQFSQGKTLTITVKPSVRKLIYTTATSAVGYEISPPKYLDTSNNRFAQHYGLKMWFADVQLNGTNGGHCFRFTTDYWIEYRSPINQY